MEWTFDPVAGPYRFTEGPVWDGRYILFSDIPTSTTYRYDPADGTCIALRTDTQEANGQTLDAMGRLIQCRHKGRSVVRYSDPLEPGAQPEVLADSFTGKRLNSPNDVVVDRLGRIWFTDPRYGAYRDDMELGHESVYRLDPQEDGSFAIHRVTHDTTSPNGLIITPDMRTLYVAESKYGEGQARELRAYPVNDDGSLGAYRVLHNFYPHRGIDGMRLDSAGNIVATAGSTDSGPGPMIYLFTPQGRVLETHPAPANPTNCCFGDADGRTLYVTAADGRLYRARTDRIGMADG